MNEKCNICGREALFVFDNKDVLCYDCLINSLAIAEEGNEFSIKRLQTPKLVKILENIMRGE